MHEFALTNDLLTAAREESRNAGIVRLDKIIVRIGDLSGICIDSIEFAFGFLKEEDEMTKNTELVVERIPGKGKCTQCGREIELDKLFLYCPYCETSTVEITEGRDFIIARLEGVDELEEAESAKSDEVT